MMHRTLFILHVMFVMALTWAVAAPARGQMSPEQAMELLRQAEAEEEEEDQTAKPSFQPSEQPAKPAAHRGPVPWDRMPRRLQAMFERERHGYLRVGERIVAIDGWLQRARLSRKSNRREPFTTPDAPLFYDPVLGEHARTPSAFAPEADLDAVTLLYGTVADRNHGMALINTVHGLAVVNNWPKNMPRDRNGRVLVITRAKGEATIQINGQSATVPAVERLEYGPVRKVSAAELARWVQAHDIERFEQWRARKVWDRRPEAKRVYESAGQMGGRGIGVGRAEPREVITDPGQYHWEWIRGGRRIPPVIALPESDDQAASSPPENHASSDSAMNDGSDETSESASQSGAEPEQKTSSEPEHGASESTGDDEATDGTASSKGP